MTGTTVCTSYNKGISATVAYPELVSRGVSERRKCKWLVRVVASNGVTLLIKKIMVGGGGVSGQPENPLDTPLRYDNCAMCCGLQMAAA